MSLGSLAAKPEPYLTSLSGMGFGTQWVLKCGKAQKESFPMRHSTLLVSLFLATLPKLMAIPKLAFNSGPTSSLLDRPLTFLVCLHYLLQLVLGPRSQNFDDDTLFGSYALWIKISAYWRGPFAWSCYVHTLFLSRGTRKSPRKISSSLCWEAFAGGCY